MALFAAFGDLTGIAIPLSIWLGLFVLYTLLRRGYFAERVPLRLMGATGPHLEKLRKTTGRPRTSPTVDMAYLTAEEADSTEGEVQPEDRVLGIEVNGQAVAYPLAAMGLREVVHEDFDGTRIDISWWPVTYSARAFAVDDRRSNEAFYDPVRKTVLNSSVLIEDTGNLMVQFIGQVVRGPDQGKDLSPVPVVSTNWRAWSSAYPHTDVLSKAGTPRLDVFERYYTSGRAGLHQSRARDRRWRDKDIVLGVEVNGHVKAYPYLVLIEQPLINEEIGRVPVLIAHERITATAVAFERVLDGRTLSFRGDTKNRRRPPAVKDGEEFSESFEYEPWLLVDEQTGSQWRAISGMCVSGELKGKQLKMLPAMTGFWFAWTRFFPDADVMKLVVERSGAEE